MIAYLLGRLIPEKPKKAHYVVLLGLMLIFASFNVVTHYANESFEQIPTSVLHGHWFLAEYGATRTHVFDQSGIVYYYNCIKFTPVTVWETWDVSAPFLNKQLKYYIVDINSQNFFKFFLGTQVLSQFEENATVSSQFNIIYDSPTVRMLMRNG
jgi:hypothetical protein